jgi:hypothetical protein
MSLNPDQQCITTLLVQSEVGVESIREILGVDKRTITKYIKRQGLSPHTKTAPPGNGTPAARPKPLPRELPSQIRRVAEDFVQTRDLQQLCDVIDTLDYPSTVLLLRHIAQLLQTQNPSSPDESEEAP